MKWLLENNQCMGVSCDQWRTSISWVWTMACEKQVLRVGLIGDLRLYRSRMLAEVKFLLAVPTPDWSFMCTNSLQLLSCSTLVSPSKNENITLYFLYVCVPHFLSRPSGSILQYEYLYTCLCLICMYISLLVMHYSIYLCVVCVYIDTHTCVCVCVCIYIYIYIYIYIFMCVYVYIYIYIYIYTHTCMYVYT